MAKRRSIQLQRPGIRKKFEIALATEDPEILKELLRELREQIPELVIDERAALNVLQSEISQKRLARASLKPHRKS